MAGASAWHTAISFATVPARISTATLITAGLAVLFAKRGLAVTLVNASLWIWDPIRTTVASAVTSVI